MSIRIEWDAIKARVNGSPYEMGEPFLFILPHGGRLLLLSVIQRLTWEASFRTAGYDYSDWDELQAIVEETTQGLMETEQVNLITEQLTRIADAIEGIEGEGNAGSSIDALTAVLTALDPRLAALLQLVNGIEDVMGGSVELPPPSE